MKEEDFLLAETGEIDNWQGQELRVVSRCFSLRDAKDALPLSVALDQGGNPEDCFKHLLLLSVRM